MDRLIAPNSVPLASADTAPVSGTPQYATDGNPAASIPATQWPAYQYNAIQEELINAIESDGTTPDRTNNAQLKAKLTGRLLNIQVFPTAGTFTYTPTPGTNSAIVEVQGSAGAGGSCSGNGGSTCSSGGGGCSGSLAVVQIPASVLGASQTVTIGSGGAPAAAGTNRGGTGGTTSFGPLVSIAGSTGGSGGAAQAVGGTYTADGGASGAITISASVPTTLYTKPGHNGETGLAICSVAISEVLYGGSGSESKFGSGGGRTGVNTNGAAGSRGGGGSGGCSGASDGGGRVGGAGGGGFIIIYEYS